MCHNHTHSKTKQRPLHWHKLPTHITFIINKRKYSNHFSSIQHPGLKHKHSTHIALHNIFHQITRAFTIQGFHTTVAVALDMSNVFDAVNVQTYTQTHTNKHFKHHHQVYSKLHKRMTSMYSIQWHIKTQINQY